VARSLATKATWKCMISPAGLPVDTQKSGLPSLP
jgi:hypothetical protein